MSQRTASDIHSNHTQYRGYNRSSYLPPANNHLPLSSLRSFHCPTNGFLRSYGLSDLKFVPFLLLGIVAHGSMAAGFFFGFVREQPRRGIFYIATSVVAWICGIWLSNLTASIPWVQC